MPHQDWVCFLIIIFDFVFDHLPHHQVSIVCFPGNSLTLFAKRNIKHVCPLVIIYLHLTHLPSGIPPLTVVFTLPLRRTCLGFGVPTVLIPRSSRTTAWAGKLKYYYAGFSGNFLLI